MWCAAACMVSSLLNIFARKMLPVSGTWQVGDCKACALARGVVLPERRAGERTNVVSIHQIRRGIVSFNSRGAHPQTYQESELFGFLVQASTHGLSR
jgi:glutaredoxin-related protein